MSQAPTIAWEPSQSVASEPEPPPAVEVKVESFEAEVEKRAREQIATIKLQTDAQRMNAAVAERVAELVKELGLPPPKTEDETIDDLTQSKLDEFEVQRLNFLATERARDIFFDRHPSMRTAEKKGGKKQ